MFISHRHKSGRTRSAQPLTLSFKDRPRTSGESLFLHVFFPSSYVCEKAIFTCDLSFFIRLILLQPFLRHPPTHSSTHFKLLSKLAMNETIRALSEDGLTAAAQLVLQVHDELILGEDLVSCVRLLSTA